MCAAIVIAIGMAASGGVLAQEPSAPLPVTQAVTPPAKAPEVSETSKLRLQTFAQQADNAKLRQQLAQAQYDLAQTDYDKARTALDALVRSLQVDGYTLDLGTLTYAKRESQPPAKKDDAVK
jgi:hypothetical protein